MLVDLVFCRDDRHENVLGLRTSSSISRACMRCIERSSHSFARWSLFMHSAFAETSLLYVLRTHSALVLCGLCMRIMGWRFVQHNPMCPIRAHCSVTVLGFLGDWNVEMFAKTATVLQQTNEAPNRHTHTQFRPKTDSSRGADLHLTSHYARSPANVTASAAQQSLECVSKFRTENRIDYRI